jgi:hypothetical protein
MLAWRAVDAKAAAMNNDAILMKSDRPREGLSSGRENYTLNKLEKQFKLKV